MPYRPARAWIGPPVEVATTIAHTDVVVTPDGSVLTGSAHEPALLTLDADGGIAARTRVPFVTELHGLTLVEEDGEAALWIADSGTKYVAEGETLVGRSGPAGGQVVQVDLRGRIRRRLVRPPGATADYAPTDVAVDERRHGGSGDVWVADGYGASLVHRYSADGRHRGTLRGSDECGPFAEPHGLLIDRRRDEPELYVADRRHGRLQVFDLDGRFKRVVGADVLIGPTFMALSGELLLVTDLVGRRVTAFDSDDRFVEHVLPHPEPFGWDALEQVAADTGWPNARTSDGRVVPPLLTPEALGSPHGIAAAAADGSLYVTEFLLGGRMWKLDPTGAR